ncbi:MAG: hypothetical protein QXK24_02285 [Ignisphaera sp.]
MLSIDEFVNNELIFVRNYVRDLPLSLVIAFSDTFEGLDETKVKEKQSKIYEMYRLSLDKSALNLRLAINREVKMIVKADGISIKQDGEVNLRTRGDTILIGSIDQFGSTAEEIENNIREWLLITVSKGNPRLRFDNAYIRDVEPLQGYRDIATAKRLLDEYDFNILDLLLLGFGIKPCYDTYRLYFPRFATQLFYDGRPVHVIQLTNTDSGKSYFSIRMEFVDNWTHFTEFPSPAKLIFDGRTGLHGAVFTSRGIAIDEFDKLKKDRFTEAYQPLNTGLENGIWRRGVQTFAGISLEGYRYVPFLIFGNIVNGEQPISTIFNENTRKYITDKLSNLTGMNAESFVERFALVDIIIRKIPISKYLIRNEKGVVGVLKDSIIRGLITLAEQKLTTKYIDFDGKLEGRLQRHGEAMYNVLYTLTGYEVPDIPTFASAILGDIDFGNLLITPSLKFEKKAEISSSENKSFDLSKVIEL